MALCYASLGERRAVLKSLALAAKAFENRNTLLTYAHSVRAIVAVPLVLAAILNPGNWEVVPELITEEQFAEFSTAIQGATSQPDPDFVDASSWKAGNRHPTQPNVVAGAAPNEWRPAPGYSWVNESNDDLRVEWSPGRAHPDHPNVVAGSEEGKMIPAPGFKWLNDSPADFQVVPQ
jgi:hypothetical protein